jgi:hypothetical protein
MRAVDQWEAIRASLPEAWEDAHLAFVAEDASAVPVAAAVLAPLGPGRMGDELRFHVRRSGAGSAQTAINLLGRLDRKRIRGTLTLVDARVAAARAREPAAARSRLVDGWDAAVRAQSPGWSDLLCVLQLDSSDYLPRAALLGAPLNPTRVPGEIALRFRVSGKQGYGTSPGMTRRCLERMDEEQITGRVAVLHALSDTENAVTQGPVWRIAGRSV